jgi:hypothetical protein
VLRVVSFCVAIGFTPLAATALASPMPAGGPALPQASKPVVAYAAWNNLMHKALDGDASSATELGRMYAHGPNAPHDLPEAMRWLRAYPSRPHHLGKCMLFQRFGG